MDMSLSRRSFGKLIAGTTATAACVQLGRSAAFAAPSSGYRAMVGIYLNGGNDGWNMVVPVDNRYAAYKSGRGGMALDQGALTVLPGSNFALHSSLAPLQQVWNDGGLGLVLNTGSLYQPLTKAQYQASPDLRPLNLMDHQGESDHWQGNRMRDPNPDGFMGRLSDRVAQTALPSMMSFAGGNLAQIGKASAALWMGSAGIITQSGVSTNSADPVAFARSSAVTTFADTTAYGTVTATTGSGITNAYSQLVTANSVLAPSTSSVDSYFVDANGNALTSDVAQQLLRIARMIAARDTLGHSRQTFFVQQGGYDTHTNQIGTHQALYGALGPALLAFYNAMKGLGLSQNVTTFTMSDFGRVYMANGSAGTDHAWGNNHLVIGGGLKPKSVFGTYPSQILGGADDMVGDGRFIPTIAVEEYVGAIAKWHGVSDSDMPYVFPNWATWSNNGRGPLALFTA